MLRPNSMTKVNRGTHGTSAPKELKPSSDCRCPSWKISVTSPYAPPTDRKFRAMETRGMARLRNASMSSRNASSATTPNTIGVRVCSMDHKGPSTRHQAGADRPADRGRGCAAPAGRLGAQRAECPVHRGAVQAGAADDDLGRRRPGRELVLNVVEHVHDGQTAGQVDLRVG